MRSETALAEMQRKQVHSLCVQSLVTLPCYTSDMSAVRLEDNYVHHHGGNAVQAFTVGPVLQSVWMFSLLCLHILCISTSSHCGATSAILVGCRVSTECLLLFPLSTSKLFLFSSSFLIVNRETRLPNVDLFLLNTFVSLSFSISFVASIRRDRFRAWSTTTAQ